MARTLTARSAGLTLVELLLAMAITAIIGASVALMLGAALDATASQENARASLVCQQRAADRILAQTRSSQMVLSAGADYLVLWTGDSRVNEKPNRSELCRIERDPLTGELWVYRPPAVMAEADDLSYSVIVTDFNATTRNLKEQAVLLGELWATDIAALSFLLDHADPRQARLVWFRMSGADQPEPESVAGAAALRGQ